MHINPVKTPLKTVFIHVQCHAGSAPYKPAYEVNDGLKEAQEKEMIASLVEYEKGHVPVEERVFASAIVQGGDDQEYIINTP